jgi:hypothetical protein
MKGESFMKIRRKQINSPSSYKSYCDKKDNCKSCCNKSSINEIICNDICGNLLLSDEIQSLEIWKNIPRLDAILTISVFNNDMSTTLIRVLMNDNEERPVEFTVPPGNTLSVTVENIESIRAIRVGNGLTRGKFCLKVCTPVFYGSKCNHKKGRIYFGRKGYDNMSFCKKERKNIRKPKKRISGLSGSCCCPPIREVGTRSCINCNSVPTN